MMMDRVLIDVSGERVLIDLIRWDDGSQRVRVIGPTGCVSGTSDLAMLQQIDAALTDLLYFARRVRQLGETAGPTGPCSRGEEVGRDAPP